MHGKNLLSVISLILACAFCGCYASLLQRGRMYEEMGDYSSAILSYEHAAKTSNLKKKAAAQGELGRLYIKFGKYWEAEKLLKEAKKNLDTGDKNYDQVNYNLGYCYYELGDQWANVAIGAFEEALRVNEELSEAHLYLGVLFYKAAGYKKAISHLDRVTDERHKAQALYIGGMSHWKLVEHVKANKKIMAAAEVEKTPQMRNKYQQTAKAIAEDLRKKEREEEKIREAKLEEVFASIYKYYDDNPIGNVKVENLMDKTLQDVKLSVYVEAYMDEPKVHALKNLIPRETVNVPITAKFTPKILDVKGEPQDQPISLKLEYTVEGEKVEEMKRGESITIHGRNAMKWSEAADSPENHAIAAFITPQDPTVQKFARAVSTADKPMEKAIQIYDALYLLGIGYLRDPNDPYVGAGVDKIYYPHETLQSKKGDCDDLTVLYASCLQSVGIEAAVLLPEGHIFIAFDAGLSPTRAKRVIQDESLFKIKSHEDKSTGQKITKVWIPVEATMLGQADKSFFDAWQEGARRLRTLDLTPIPVSQAWETYKPALVAEEVEMHPPEQDVVSQMYYGDLAKAEEHWKNTLGRAASALEGEIEENKAEYEDETINRLGILYAKRGDLEKAEKLFREAAQKAPSKASYWNNLANVLLLIGNIEEAEKYYQQAEKQGEDDAYIYFNRAIFYFVQRDQEKAIQAIQDAQQKSSPELYSVLQQELGIIVGDGGRAADEDITSKFESIMSHWENKKARSAKIEELLQELTAGESEEIKLTYRTVLMALSKEQMQELFQLDKQQILEKLKPKKPAEGQPKISETDLQALITEAIGKPAEGGSKVRAAGISEPEDLRWWLSWLQ